MNQFGRVKTCHECKRIIRAGLRVRGGIHFCADRRECRKAYEAARRQHERPTPGRAATC